MTFTDIKGREFRPSGMTKFALLLASMMVLMGSAAVSPALHGIETELGADHFLVSMIISLPSLVVAVLGFPMGYLADRVGLAKTLLVSLAVFVIAGVAGHFCTDIYTILATRVFLGVGIAGISTASTGLMGIYYTGAERQRVMAVQSAFMGFGGVVLEAIGGVMADVAWNTPFLIYLIALPILIAGLFAVRDVVLPGMEQGEAEKFAEGSKARMAVLYISIFMLMFVMFIVSANISEIMTNLGESMTVCGLVLAFMGLTQTVTSMIYSRLHSTPRYGVVLFAAFVLQGVAMMLFASDSLIVLTLGVGILGVGLGIGMPTITNNLAMMSPASSQGKTMGIYACLMNLGTSLSAVVMGPVIAAVGYTTAFHAVAIVVILFGVTTVILGKVLGSIAGPVKM